MSVEILKIKVMVMIMSFLTDLKSADMDVISENTSSMDATVL